MTHEHEILPTPDNPDPHGIYIDEVQARNRRIRKLIQFTHSSTKSAGIMLLAAIVALFVANSPLYEVFFEFWHHNDFGIIIGSVKGELSFSHIINDVFMSIFFLLVGLEIKYEMMAGELTNIRQAILPILAAVGGVIAPIGIYLLFNFSNPVSANGWGVPTATDIAFALGIMALLGSRVPNGLKVFLSTLAVADDIIAILVIAIFYGQSPNLFWLGITAVIYLALIIMNRRHVYSLVPYIIGGCALWVSVYLSGVHATIAGVLLAFVIPCDSRVNFENFFNWQKGRVDMANDLYEGEETPLIAQKGYLTTMASISRVSAHAVPPATRLEHKLHPWVNFLILPLFALTNADIELSGLDVFTTLTSPVFFGVFFGLVVGKTLGILLFSFITIKLRISTLPENVNWFHMIGAAILGGVGFTMAIFVANLAYTDALLITQAKLAILVASLFAGILGFCFLFIQAAAGHKK